VGEGVQRCFHSHRKKELRRGLGRKLRSITVQRELESELKKGRFFSQKQAKEK
jgi:hypothetical protein